jgi:hypothetical protein
MSEGNFDTALDALRKNQPFQIFTVELVGGRKFAVDHPDAMVGRDRVAVFLAPGGSPIWFDHEGVRRFIGDLAIAGV